MCYPLLLLCKTSVAVLYPVVVPLLFDCVLSPVISESPSMRGFFYWTRSTRNHGIFGSGRSSNPLYIAKVAEMICTWVSVDSISIRISWFGSMIHPYPPAT